LVYLGLVGICDPPKPFVRESIEQLYTCGVKVKLVTGDAQETAVAIGTKHTIILLKNIYVKCINIYSAILLIENTYIGYTICLHSLRYRIPLSNLH